MCDSITVRSVLTPGFTNVARKSGNCYIIFLSKSKLGSHQSNQQKVSWKNLNSCALYNTTVTSHTTVSVTSATICRVAAEFKCSYIYLHVLYARVWNVRASPRDFLNLLDCCRLAAATTASPGFRLDGLLPLPQPWLKHNIIEDLEKSKIWTAVWNGRYTVLLWRSV